MSWPLLILTIIGSIAGSLMYALLSERFGPHRGMFIAVGVFLSLWIILGSISSL